MVLNKRQKEAFQFLKYLSDCYLDGRTPVINEVDFNKLGEIGVNINRVCSGHVPEKRPERPLEVHHGYAR